MASEKSSIFFDVESGGRDSGSLPQPELNGARLSSDASSSHAHGESSAAAAATLTPPASTATAAIAAANASVADADPEDPLGMTKPFTAAHIRQLLGANAGSEGSKSSSIVISVDTHNANKKEGKKSEGDDATTTTPPLLSSSSVSPERMRQILEYGGPETRGKHSLNPKAPDAKRDPPPDLLGPPRYLRSRGITPQPSARARSRDRAADAASRSKRKKHQQQQHHHRRSDDDDAGGSHKSKKASAAARRGRAGRPSASSSASSGSGSPSSEDDGSNDSDHSDDDGDAVRHGKDKKSRKRGGKRGKSAKRDKKSSRHSASARSHPDDGGAGRGKSQPRGSILAPTEDELTSASNDGERTYRHHNNTNKNNNLYMGYQNHRSAGNAVRDRNGFGNGFGGYTFPADTHRGVGGPSPSPAASSRSPLREPPPRSHSPVAGHRARGREWEEGGAVPSTRRPSLSPNRPERAYATTASTAAPSAPPNMYGQPRLAAEEEGMGGYEAPHHHRRRPNNRDPLYTSGLVPTPSSFLSEIRRSPTSMGGDGAGERLPRSSSRGDPHRSRSADASLPDGVGPSLHSHHRPPTPRAGREAAGAAPAAYSEVFSPSYPWERTRIPPPSPARLTHAGDDSGCSSSNGVGGGGASHGAAGADKWEVSMARRALEQFRHDTTANEDGMTGFIIVVKRMPGAPGGAGGENPLVVRVFVPTGQLSRVRVAHLKLELHRRLHVPAEFQDLRTEGVRLLDELPLDLLEPHMVIFADLSSAPVDIVARERARVEREQRQEQQQHEKKKRDGVRRQSKGRQPSPPAEQRRHREEWLPSHYLACSEGASPTPGEDRGPSRDTARRPRSPTPLASSDAIDEHIQRLRQLIGLDGSVADPPPSQQQQQRQHHHGDEDDDDQNHHHHTRTPQRVPSPSSSMSSLDTLSTVAGEAPPVVEGKYGSLAKGSGPAGAAAAAAAVRRRNSTGKQNSNDDNIGAGKRAGAGAVPGTTGSSRGTSAADYDDFVPVAYGRARFRGQQQQQFHPTAADAAAVRGSHGRRGGDSVWLGAAGNGDDGEEKEEEAVVFIGSVVRPFQLAPHRSSPAAKSKAAAAAAASRSVLSTCSSPKPTTAAAAAELPVPPLRFYNSARHESRSSPPRHADPSGLVHDDLVAYPEDAAAAAPRRHARLEDVLSSRLGADLPTQVSSGRAAAIAKAGAASRERIRQALALERATAALRTAERAREDPPRPAAAAGAVDLAAKRPFALDHHRRRPNAGDSPHSGVAAAAMRFPVPEEGGVSGEDFSVLEQLLPGPSDASSSRGVDDDELLVNGQQRRRPSFAGVTAVDPATVEGLFSA